MHVSGHAFWRYIELLISGQCSAEKWWNPT